MNFTMKEYLALRDDLFAQACINRDVITAEVIQYYLKYHVAEQIGFGKINIIYEDNIRYEVIDKYYIIKFPEVEGYFRFWTSYFFETDEEEFFAQTPTHLMFLPKED